MSVREYGISASVTLPDKTVFSIPSGYDSPEGSASWRLKHSKWEPNESERMAIASILDSFSYILTLKSKKRQVEIIDGIFHEIGMRRRGE